MENNQLLIPERVRQYPTLRGFDVPEAQIVSVEPFPVATEEEAPLPFIEANSAAVSWKELTEESILPSYADGEIVVPHSHFIQALVMAAHDALPQDTFGPVEIRASHLTQGRVPSAIYKKTSELLESDKTKYWERICFCVQITSRQTTILGEPCTLTFGGCRSLQDINFHSRKSSEVFQAYISFRARICSNLMISLQDGLKDRIEATGPAEIYAAAYQLFSQFNAEENLRSLDGLGRTRITVDQFTHLIGKLRYYNCLSTADKRELPFQIELGDSQVYAATRNFVSGHFGLNGRDSVDLFQMLNCFNQASKSSYLHNFLLKNANCTELALGVQRSLEGTNHDYDWLLS